MRCTACEHENAGDATFCAACGARLAQRCPACGAEAKGGARFCGDCGTSLTAPRDTLAERASPDGERRQLTVVFCDLVGSTALAARLDPEDLRDVLRAYQQRVEEVVARFAGYVAKNLGDGLLIYFGWPTAREDDPERAVRAGLAIVDALVPLNATLAANDGTRLAVRIGLHTGPVVIADGGEVFGETANIAARVQSAAAPDTVVITAVTQRLVAGMFVVEDRGPQELKGVREPVTLYRVVQPSGVRSRLAVAVGRLTRFVGREHERALLVDRWERAKEGEGQVVLVRGEAGIGKSRLVQTLREHLAGTPHTWLECAASPFFSNTPFFAVAELLRQGFAWRGDEPSEAQVAALERALEAVGLRSEDAVPLVAPLLDLPVSDRFSPPLMSAEQQRRKLLATLVVWVTALARAQPTVLVLEDLHWADPSTLELQELLVAQGAMEPLLLVYTTRPVFTPHWPTRSHHTVLALGRLSRTQTREMIRRMTPSGAIDDEVADLVVGRTDGVPLFVEELTRLVLERSGEAVRTIPETLQDSLMARLDRLGPAKEIAQVGAAIGREFSYALLEATSPAPAAELERALRTLVNSELVHGRGVPPEATYVFRHALVQEAAYAALLKSRRRDLHRAIATALGLRFAAIVADRPELLAHHLTEAGHDERAVPYWFQAGQRSTERSAHVEAIRSLTRGLECVGRLPDGEGRRVLELGLRTLLGANLLAVRGYTAPEVSANCARSLALLAGVDDSSQVRPVVWALWLHHLVLADRDTTRELAVQFHGAAVRGDDDDEALCRAHITNAITAYWQGEFERTRQHAAEARTLYRPEMRLKLPQYGDDSGPYGYIYEAMSLWFQGRPDQARVWIQKGIGVARETHYAFTFAAALSFATQLEQLCRDAAATEALAERTIAYCQEQGFPLYLGAALAHRGWARATQGSVAQGLEDLVAGITLYRATGAVLNVNYLLALIAEAYLLAGDRARGLAAADEGLALAAQHLDTYFVAELHRIRGALLLLAPADPDGAEAALRQALAVAHTQGAAELALRAAIGLGRLLGARGHAADARSLLAEHVARGREAGDRPDLLDAQALLTALA